MQMPVSVETKTVPTAFDEAELMAIFPEAISVEDGSFLDLLAGKHHTVFTFDGRVQPPKYKYYSVTKDGVTYEANFKLDYFIYSPKKDKTTAYYLGELKPVE